MVRIFAILSAVLLLAFAFTACTSDCIYKLFESNDGGELCGRYCPKEDDEGNEISLISLDRSGKPMNDALGNAVMRTTKHDEFGNSLEDIAFDDAGRRTRIDDGWAIRRAGMRAEKSAACTPRSMPRGSHTPTRVTSSAFAAATKASLTRGSSP